MMSLFPRSFSIMTAIRDLRDAFGGGQQHRWRILGLAIAAAGLFFTLIILQFTGQRDYKEAEVTYVKQWPKSRSVEEVRAQQIKDAPAERAENVLRKEQEAKRREQFRKAGEALKRLGM